MCLNNKKQKNKKEEAILRKSIINKLKKWVMQKLAQNTRKIRG